MLVHDLRLALGIINWNMELMLDGVLGEVTPEQERFLQGSIESTQELLDMIDSCLISIAETGALDLERVPLDLAGLAEEISRRMEFVTHQLHLRFDISFDAGFPVMADKQLIRRVLLTSLTPQNMHRRGVRFMFRVPSARIVSAWLLRMKARGSENIST